MYDIIIIGGGAAGSAAAMFAARAKFKTLLIDKGPEFGHLGGLAIVGDMPGLVDNVSGTEILNRIKKQARDLGAEIKTASVTSCSVEGEIKRVVTNEPVTHETKVIILATGNTPQQDSHHVYHGEVELRGKGVSHDVEADALASRHCAVAIVGKSIGASEAVLTLSKYAEKIYWIVPASRLDVSNQLRDELERIKKVEMFFSSSLKRINGTSEVTSVTILTAGQEKTLGVKYIFLPPQQHKPVTDYLNGSGIQTGEEGVIMVGQEMETSAPGVFAAGNILCTKPQLNVVCAAQGAIVALNAEKYLRR